jgi:hypothetical protein
MGSNAQRRREAKNRVAVVRDLSGSPREVESPVFNPLGRTTCSECGSANIESTTISDLVSSGSPERRERAAELLAFFGAGAAAWSCSDCVGFGTSGLMLDDAPGFTS